MKTPVAFIITRLKTSLPSGSDAAINIIHATDAMMTKRPMPLFRGRRKDMMNMPYCVVSATENIPSANIRIQTDVCSAAPNSMKAAEIITTSILNDYSKKSLFLKRIGALTYELLLLYQFFGQGGHTQALYGEGNKNCCK